jgi:YbgC/YbaW family acyl-CoA thioester hydrolase
MPTKFTTNFHVRSYEMDSFGHVNNAVYLQYLEYARGEFLRQQGLSFADFAAWNTFPYVIHVDITYKSSCRAHDEIKVVGWISKWSKAGFVMDYEMHNCSSGRLCVEAQIRFAFVNDQEKIVPVPEEFISRMQ